MDRIPINIDLIPYKMNIELAGNVFIFEFKYNSTIDLYTISLYNSQGILMCANEPIVYGVELFSDIYEEGFPYMAIVPSDEAGNSNAVTSDNIEKTVFLNIYNDENTEIKYSGEVGNLTDFQKPILNFMTVAVNDLKLIENAVIDMGGTVEKSAEIPTIGELIEGIFSIPQSGGSKLWDVYYGRAIDVVKG
ncbi:MAG: hypothetical protein MJ230_01545 [bacterium]|nr:hypothetical protein [bacterium]